MVGKGDLSNLRPFPEGKDARRGLSARSKHGPFQKPARKYFAQRPTGLPVRDRSPNRSRKIRITPPPRRRRMNALFAPGAKWNRLLVAAGLALLVASPAMLLWASRPSQRDDGSLGNPASVELALQQRDARLEEKLL